MLRAGLIGFGATGKTTLFRLLTSAPDAGGHGKADAHIGIARVPDERLDKLVGIFGPRKRVPATFEFADLAGAGHADAKALHNVAPFRNADALVHVLRVFRDQTVPNPAGSIDPARDAQAMEDELVLADLDVAERRLDRVAKDLRKNAVPELRREQEVLFRCKEALEDGRPLRSLSLPDDDRKRLKGFQFLSAKPLLLVVNLDEADAADLERAADRAGLSPFLERGETRAVGVCARIELEIAQLEAPDAHAFLADLGLRETGLDRVIRASYDLLGYISFFTIGDDEIRAWSIRRGTPAQAAAGTIHTDMARGFIRAEVVDCDTLVARGSFAACREHAELRLEGKDYVVRNGDVINVRFAT
jgi:GTP-binding protein YchF